MRDMVSAEDLQYITNDYNEDGDEIKTGIGKAHSDNFAGPQASNLTTGSQTEIDRRDDNELEAMTGSFLHDANNKNSQIEDEYFEHDDEEGSFVRAEDLNLQASPTIESTNIEEVKSPRDSKIIPHNFE